MRRIHAALISALAVVAVITATTPAQSAERTESYVVVLKDSASTAPAMPGRVQRTFTAAVRGYEVTMPASAAHRLARHPAVAMVVPNQVHSLPAQQAGVLGVQPAPPSWGLDRIDQRFLPLDGSYTFPNTARNVRAYILSTGVRVTHTDFGGRAIHGWDTVDNDNNATDCNGHGTFMAGIVGGAKHGVAKSIKLVAMRVLNCSGSATTAQIIAGIDWVTANAVKPAVAVLPIGGGANLALDTAVRNSIRSGITYTTTAGSSGPTANSCNYSPARVGEALTVGGTSSIDAVVSSSSGGGCIDLFAPGGSIVSTWHTSDVATATLSGGSAASAFTGGAAALILSPHPNWTPAQVHSEIVADATPGVLSNVPPGAPNLLLYVDNSP